MKALIICRPRPGIGRAEIAPHATAEMAALEQLRIDGALLEAYSPGGPGAVLIVDDRASVDRVLRSLPLVREGLVEAEVIELHPFN
jgi:hypothetical protein